MTSSCPNPRPDPDHDPWTIAKNRFLADLNDKERELFHSANLENVYYAISNANRADSENSKTRLAVRKLSPLVSAIENYGKAFDTLTNIAPLYLAPIWGCIRVVLAFARAHSKFYEKIVDTLSRIGDVLPRFRDYERIFNRNKHRRLTQALSDAYLDIIVVCTDFRGSINEQKASSVRRMFKPVVQTTKHDEAIELFRRHKNKVDEEARTCHLLEEAEHRKAQLVVWEAERRRIILSRLSRIDCLFKHGRLQTSRHPGTGQWLTCSDEFRKWNQSESSAVLCCYGIPGCGKSVLASSTIDHLRAINSQSVIFYYCDYADKRTLEPANVFGTLARTVLESFKGPIPELLAREIEQAVHDGERLTDQVKALDFLDQSIHLLTSPVFIAVDGLDEASEASQRLICKGLKRVLESASTSIKLFITGREDMRSLLYMKTSIQFSRLCVSSSTIAQDIESYVRASTRQRLVDGLLALRDKGLEELIVDKLVEGAKGMFLWVEFQLQDLCETETDHEIKVVLQNLPESLSETYDRLLSKLENLQKQNLIKRMFQWIVCARRPLRVEELLEGISFTLDDKTWTHDKIVTNFHHLVKGCSNLVVIHEETQTVQLAHYTVHQYLLQHKKSRFQFSLRDANIMAGEFCLAYLNFPDFETRLNPYRENANTNMVAWNKVAGSGQPLIPYDNHGRDVVRAWNHFRRAKPVHLDINIARHVNLPKSKARSLTDFAFLPYVASNWLWHSIDFAYGGAIGGDSAHRQKQKVRRDTLFRDLAVQKQLLFEFRPWGTFDDNNQKLSSIALLGWALMTNHSYLISMTSIDEELLRPPVLILEAYRWFRDDVIEPTNAPRVTDAHLVRLKAFSEDSYSLESPELGWLYSRMLCAARRGHLDVIQACGLTIHEKLDYFWGHLIVEAAAAGQASFIKWVHENLALDSSFTDFTVTHESNHYSAIERSLLAGQTEALIALSRLGYPVNTLLPDEASFYKLMDTAIHDKNVKVTESLLFLLHEHSSPVFAQINMKGPEISDLFLNAVKIGNKCVIDVMLKHGIGPDIQDKNGLTALVVAITASHLQLVETLLQRGCKTGNTRFGLPLTIATCLGSLEIASLLVEYGAEIFKDESNYANDLVFFEQFSIDDAEPATHLCLSPTPLYMAAYCGHREITEMLIRRGAAVNVASPAALFSFTDQNTFPDIDRLTWDIDLSLQNIGRLADIDPRSWNEKGFSRWEYPITVAVVEGHSEIVSLLLGAGSTTSRLSPSQIDNQPNDWLRAKVREAPSVRNDFRHGDACQIEYKLFTNFFLSISRISYRQCEILIAGGGKTSIILDRLRYGPFLYALQAGHRMMAERMFRDIPAQSLGRLSFRGIKTMLNAGDGIQIPDPILIAAAQAGNLEVRTEFIKWGAEAVVRVFNDLNNCNPEDRERNFEMFHLITSSIIHESWLVTLDMCSYYKILRRVAQCDNTSAELVMKLLSLLVSQRRTGISQIEPILHYAFATGRGRKMLRALLEFGRLVQLIGDDRDEELLTAILWNHIQAVNGLIEAKFDFRRAFFVRALDLCVSLERENIWKRLIGWKEQAPHGPSNTITLHLIFERQRADNIRLPPTLCHGINCEPGDVGTEAPVGLISHAISTDQGSIPSENSAKGFETCATNGSSALVYRKPDDKSDDQEAPAKYVQHLTLPIYAVARGEYLLSLPCRSVPGLFELA